MTHAEEIMQAVASLMERERREVFSREEIRRELGLSRDDWAASYSPTFQGMRVDEPGGARTVGTRFKGVFRRVEHGKHTLTDYGRQLLAEPVHVWRSGV